MNGLELLRALLNATNVTCNQIRPTPTHDTSQGQTCLTCQVENSKLRKCTRCKRAMYCGKECQAKDFARHKEACLQLASFDKARAAIDPERYGDVPISYSLADVTDTERHKVLGPCRYVLVEITQVQLPSLQDTATVALVKDALNQTTGLVFHLLNSSGVPLNVKIDSLEKGNFLLIKHGRWNLGTDGRGPSSLIIEDLNQAKAVVSPNSGVDWVKKWEHLLL